MATTAKLLIWKKYIQTLFEMLKSKSCTNDTRYRPFKFGANLKTKINATT